MTGVQTCALPILIALKQNKNLLGKAGEDCKGITFQKNSDGSMIYFDLVDTVNNRTYRIVHSNGVTADKKVDLAGYTLYLDTLNKSDLALTSETVVDNYQTIIAYKALN